MTVPHHPEYLSMEYESDLLGITLTCYFDYEPESLGDREFGTGFQLEPDYPATYVLAHAYTPQGLDISPVMRTDMIEALEERAYESFEGN
jgi:hypothetical protein